MSSVTGDFSRYFDRTVCLNLDRRFERRANLRGDFGQYGIYADFFLCGDGKTPCYEKYNKTLELVSYDHVDTEPPADRPGTYPAWLKRPNSFNAFLCFRKIIQQAKSDGVETLLLLEDDAETTAAFEVALHNGWRDMHEADPSWESLALGAVHHFSQTTLVSPHLLLLNGSGGWFAICLHRRVFDLVLGLPMDGPIDGVYARELHKRNHSFACWPQAVVAAPGFSFCEGYETDYRHMFGSRGC